MTPLVGDPDVRRDLRRYLLSATASEMVAATRGLTAFTKPALVVWTPEDRVMDPRHGRRIAHLLPRSTYREITDSYTLLPEDQPANWHRSSVSSRRRCPPSAAPE